MPKSGRKLFQTGVFIKLYFSTHIIYFVLISLLISCGSNEENYTNGSKPSKTYYIKFKADGERKIFHVNEPGYQSCGLCACADIPVFANEYGNISICNDDNDWITATHIESWNSSSISFLGSGFPLTSFFYTADGVDYFSADAMDQTGIAISITSVSSEGSFEGTNAMFKVKGTFQCKVKSATGLTEVVISEGSFVVRFSED